MKAGKPDHICADSYLMALSRHKDIAPQYIKKEDCESDFMKDYCVATEDGKFTPKMSGFSLITEQKQLVNTSTGQPVVNSNTDSNGFLTGILLGNMMSNSGPSYYSDPIYRRRDDRGGYTTNTMSGYANSGIKPSKSIQQKVNTYSNPKPSQSRIQSYNSSSSYNTKSSYSKPESRKISVSSSISRSGFGSISSSRSGWGG